MVPLAAALPGRRRADAAGLLSEHLLVGIPMAPPPARAACTCSPRRPLLSPQVGVLMAPPVRAAVRWARTALGTRLSRVCAERVHTPQGLARLAWTDHWTVRRKRVAGILGADAAALAPGATPWLATLRAAASSPHACELDPRVGALFPTRAEHSCTQAAAHGRPARRDQSCGMRRPCISAVAAQSA